MPTLVKRLNRFPANNTGSTYGKSDHRLAAVQAKKGTTIL